MDIRRYFGGSAGKSALTELRASRGSPIRTNPQQNQNVRKKQSKKNRETVPTEVLLSDASDEENPVPSSLRKELKKKRAKKRILLSSDEDDELPPSASEIQSSKRIGKISPKKMDSKPKGYAMKRVAHTVTTVSDDEEDEEIEELDEFVPAPPTKKKRVRTPPGQSKLDFSSFVAEKPKESPKKKATTKVMHELEAINPTEFFRNFGKTSQEAKTSVKPNESKENKVKSSKKITEIAISPHSSPKKSRNEQPLPENRKIAKNREKSSKKAEFISAKSVTVPEDMAISKQEENRKKEIKKQKKEIEKQNAKVDEQTKEIVKKTKKIDLKKEMINKGKEIDTNGGKKQSSNQIIEQKLAKIKKSAEMSRSKTDELMNIGNAIQKETNLPWVDKYKPTNLKHLVGQNGEKSPMNKLLNWLQNWAKNHLGEGAKQKKARPPPWLAQSDGTAFKAIMLSGPPGIGKTTCAVMACKELKLGYVEKNASDVRNKKVLEAQTSELIGSQQIDSFVSNLAAHKANPTNEITHVLIMDEVDGMSGNDDRAGIAELIQMIKETRIPIICICNDRQSQKMRSLVNYCFDVRFQRPRVEQIRARLLTIACQEKFEVDKEEIDEIIEAAKHDVRQSIYNLQLLSMGGKGSEAQTKDAAINPFEAARRLLNADTPAWEKQQMFFVDYSLMPLFVQENYPYVQNSKMSTNERLCALKKAANSISLGDIIDRTIRTTGAWTLLNEQALFSSVAPTTYMNGYMKGMINFPSWLGKNSTLNKRQRLLRQLATHTYLRTFSGIIPMVLDYIPVLRHRYCRPLLDKENDGVNDVIDMYKAYNLIKDDSESIAELAIWPGINDPGAAIPTKVKSALTRTLNKEHIILPYALDTVTKGRRKAAGALDVELDEEGNLVEQNGNEDDAEDSGRESDDDDDDDFAGVIKKKNAGGSMEKQGIRGGKSRGTGNRGGIRGNRGATGRGRASKK